MDNGSNVISVSELFKQSWQLYMERFSALVGIFAVPTVLSFILELVLSQDVPAGLDITLRMINILVMILFVWSQGASLLAIKSGGTSKVLDYYKQSKDKVWPLVFSGILISVIVVLGLVLLIVPGLIFSVWLMFSMFFIVYEDKKIIESIKASKELVKGRTFTVFLRMFVLIILSIVGIMAVGFVLLTVLGPLGSALGSAAASLLLAPFILVFEYILFNYLKSHAAPVSTPAPSTAV